MGWSGLAVLVDGFLDGIERLAPARATALRTALALETADEAVAPFAVALAARDLLVDAAEDTPIIVLVDDLQWIDHSTRRTLAFVARRLEVERLAIVSTRRVGGDPSADTGRAITLDALDAEDADDLLADVGVTAPGVREQLIRASRGVPLVLVEAAHLLDEDQRAGRAELPDPLPIGPSGQRVVDLVLARLSPSALTALVTAASEPAGDIGRILRALAERNLGLAELEEAESGGIVVLEGDRLTFRHPLMRSAAYYDAPRADRRAAHRALAGTLPASSPARAWHLARGAIGPDEAVAVALDEAAEGTLRRGAPTVAARTWELASRLSPEPSGRLRRLRQAAEALIDAGTTADAGHVLERADDVALEHDDADDLLERTRRRQLRLRLPASTGGAVASAETLRTMAAEVADESPDLAADLLMDALAADIRAGAMAGMVATIEDAGALRDRVDARRARRIGVMQIGLRVATGQADSDVLIAGVDELIGLDRRTAGALFAAEVVAPSLGFLRRTEESDRLLAELEQDLRTRGAMRPLIAVLGAQALARYGRSFPAAIAVAADAVELAEANGGVEQASLAGGVLALGGAVVGDRSLCERAVEALRDVPERERRVMAPAGLAYLAHHQGRHEEAVARYEPIAEILPIGQGFLRWEIEWIESLVRLGRRAEALDLIARLEDAVAPEMMALTGIGRAKGMLAADDEEAATHFADAVLVGEVAANDFVIGRAETVWGERLRRSRRRAESRRHLERAVELLRAVGATLPAERATAELRAAGGVVDDEDVTTFQLLTPHELQVAKLVVSGASNRDLALKLFISPRTVEAHLTTIFRKLGLRNRRELAARALEDPVLQP